MIQAELFLHEAFQSGVFRRLVVAKTLLEVVGAAGGVRFMAELRRTPSALPFA